MSNDERSALEAVIAANPGIVHTDPETGRRYAVLPADTAPLDDTALSDVSGGGETFHKDTLTLQEQLALLQAKQNGIKPAIRDHCPKCGSLLDNDSECPVCHTKTFFF